MSGHFCLLVSVPPSLRLSGGSKAGEESGMPSEAVGFPVLHASCSAHQDQCKAAWSVDLGQPADTHRYTAEIESKVSEILVAIRRSYFMFVP